MSTPHTPRTPRRRPTSPRELLDALEQPRWTPPEYAWAVIVGSLLAATAVVVLVDSLYR